MIIKITCGIVKIYWAVLCLQLCKVVIMDSASGFTCDGRWCYLDQLGGSIGLGMHHRDMAGSITRYECISTAAADPLVVYTLVRVEGAICWNGIFSPDNWLICHLPTS